MADDIYRTLGKLEGQISGMDTTLKSLQKDIQDVLQVTATHGPRISDLERRITALEEGKNWVMKTVGAIIIASLLGLILIKTGVPFPK